MSVYVDPLIKWGKRPGWPWPSACHLFADTIAELHAFAARIGMKRAWFQADKRLPHYDLNAARRAAAVKAGAVECDSRTMVEHMNANIATFRKSAEAPTS
jgi:hypothetical protein